MQTWSMTLTFEFCCGNRKEIELRLPREDFKEFTQSQTSFSLLLLLLFGRGARERERWWGEKPAAKL